MSYQDLSGSARITIGHKVECEIKPVFLLREAGFGGWRGGAERRRSEVDPGDGWTVWRTGGRGEERGKRKEGSAVQ